MAAERWVLLGWARPRAAWFRSVGRWAGSASIPAELVTCLSADEVSARLSSGRRYSALLADAGLPGLDRDLLADAARAGVAVFVVGQPGPVAASLVGADHAALLAPTFGRDDLLQALSERATMVGGSATLPAALDEPSERSCPATLVAVCGPGGTGVSSVAASAAQAFAARPGHAGRVLLADLALRAQQAMLHDAENLGPGVQELVEDHRTARPDMEQVWQTTFEVPARGYRLLVGLRHRSAWSALRPKAIEATIDGLLRAFAVVVADVDSDFEGEDLGGSRDVEERHHLARSSVLRADVVVAVGSPGLKGTHSLALLARDAVEHGVAPERLLLVVNRAPRNPRARAELGGALRSLTGPLGRLPGPLFLPERAMDAAFRRGSVLPAQVVRPLGLELIAMVDRLADLHRAAPPAQPVRRGSLGSWAPEVEPWDR
jgi:hypothetical protein